MNDPTQTLAQMVDHRYRQYQGQSMPVVYYQETVPQVSRAVPVFAQVSVVESTRNYLLQAGAGRQDTLWTARLVGTREAVQTASQVLAAGLNMPYRDDESGQLVMYTHVVRMGGVGRIERPAGTASQVLHFSSHIIQRTPEPG